MTYRKFNRRCNHLCVRIAFWHRMTSQLAGFDSIIKSREHLTPDDLKALKEIHKALFWCYSEAKGRLQLHQKDLRRLQL